MGVETAQQIIGDNNCEYVRHFPRRNGTGHDSDTDTFTVTLAERKYSSG